MRSPLEDVGSPASAGVVVVPESWSVDHRSGQVLVSGVERGVEAVRGAARDGARWCLILAAARYPSKDTPAAVVADHVNLTGTNPLRGPNRDDLGVRFPDMTEPYDAELREALAPLGPEVIVGGVLNTPTLADAQGAARLGCDCASDGIVHPVIAARHAGLRVAALVVADPALESQTLDGALALLSAVTA